MGIVRALDVFASRFTKNPATVRRVREFLRGFRTADARCVVALVYSAVILTVLEYRYLPTRVALRLGERGGMSVEAGLTWAIATSVLYLLPILLVKFWHKEPLSSIGFSCKGLRRHIWIYLAMYLVMLPILIYVSGDAKFQATYPFVTDARHSSDAFWKWETGYLIQFIALEAFFRGYLLFTLAKRMGYTAIFVMVVPYTMIHFHKPMLETFGAVIAGTLLGALALRLKSFYGGAILHMAVGFTMDRLGADFGG